MIFYEHYLWDHEYGNKNLIEKANISFSFFFFIMVHHLGCLDIFMNAIKRL